MIGSLLKFAKEVTPVSLKQQSLKTNTETEESDPKFCSVALKSLCKPT